MEYNQYSSIYSSELSDLNFHHSHPCVMPELGHVYMWRSSQIRPVGKTNGQAREQECLTDLLVALPKIDPPKAEAVERFGWFGE